MVSSPLIVLIEDDPADMELTVRALQRAELSTRIACFCNAATAITWLRSLTKVADLADAVLLCDRPGQVGGVALLDTLANDAQLADLRTVVLTGSRELAKADLRKSIHQPIAVLSKPLDVAELRAALHNRKPPLRATLRTPSARRSGTRAER